MGIEIPNKKVISDSRANRLSYSQKRNSKPELLSEKINKDILNFIDGRGSIGSDNLLPNANGKCIKEEENPFETNICVNEILKNEADLAISINKTNVKNKANCNVHLKAIDDNATYLNNESKQQNAESKYFSFKKNLITKESFLGNFKENSASEKSETIEKRKMLNELESQMAYISPIPKISRMDYLISDSKNKRNSEGNVANVIKLMNADFNLEEYAQQEFSSNVKNDNFNFNTNLNKNENEVADNSNNNKIEVNNDSVIKEVNNLNLNEDYFEKKQTKKSAKFSTAENQFVPGSDGKNLNNFNNKNNYYKENKDKNIFPNEKNLEFSELISNKYINSQISGGNGIDKISTVFFNSNDFKTNNFDTIELIKENFQSLGYTNCFAKQTNTKNQSEHVNDEQKNFEIIEENYSENLKNKNNKFLNNENNFSNLNLSKEELRETENNNSFHSEQAKLSKILKQNKLSFASINALQDIYINQQQSGFENEDKIKFDFMLKKRNNNLLINNFNNNKDLNLAVNDAKQNIIKDIKNKNIDYLNNPYIIENKKFEKKNSMKIINSNFDNNYAEKISFKTIDEENQINKKKNFYRNSFVNNDNNQYYNALLNNKLSSKNNLNLNTHFESNRLLNSNLDKDLIYNSEKSKNSKKRNSLDDNYKVPFQLNNKAINANKLSDNKNNKSNHNGILIASQSNADLKRKKLRKSNSLVEASLQEEMHKKYNFLQKNKNLKTINSKTIISKDNQIKKKSKANIASKSNLNRNDNNNNNKINNKNGLTLNNNINNKSNFSLTFKNNYNNNNNNNKNFNNNSEVNNTNSNNNTNNVSEDSSKLITREDFKSSLFTNKKQTNYQSNSSIKKAQEANINQSQFTPVSYKNDDSIKDLCYKSPLNNTNNSNMLNKNSKAFIKDNESSNSEITNKEESNGNLNNIHQNIVLVTQTKENKYDTIKQNECNLSQSEEKNIELSDLLKKEYDKKPKQMTTYNKSYSININKLNNNNRKIFNINENENSNSSNNSSINIQNDSIAINNHNNETKNNLNIGNNIDSNNNHYKNNYFDSKSNKIGSHKRTYSEALDQTNNFKKTEFGFHNNLNKQLNSTNLLSNSKDFGDPTEKINKIREISLGKYMHVFTDVENDKSNFSYQSSRKNSRINDTINQTDGDLSSCRFNKFSPHYNQINKFNFQANFNPNDILKNLNSNENGLLNNNNNNLNNAFSNKINESGLNDMSNFVSNFAFAKDDNKNNNNILSNSNNNLSGNNFRSKNYTPNSFRNNNAFSNSVFPNDKKIKNIFS